MNNKQSDLLFKTIIIVGSLLIWLFIGFMIYKAWIRPYLVNLKDEIKIEESFGAISIEDQKIINLMDKVINKQQLTMDEYRKIIALYDAEVKADNKIINNFKGDINAELSKRIKDKIINK